MPQTPTRRAHLIIHGRVQGVWFRQSTRQQAQQLGLSGWVRNNPDGTVETLFAGASASVEAMRRWCHQGPSAARVDRVEQLDNNISEELNGFTIR